MQDIQNIPPPDESSNRRDDDFGSHSEVDSDLDNDGDNAPIPVPPDQQPGATPIEEPPETQKPPVGEDGWEEPKQIV